MAAENLQIDENGRNVLGAITNNAAEEIKNLRVNPTTGRLLVDAVIGSTNTNIGSTIPGGTAGSILFLGIGSTLAEDNANLFYDDTNNFVGFGTNTPSATLDVVGTFQYVDGNQSNGFVLTSDGSGNATWQIAPGNAGYDLFQNGGVSVTKRNTINLTSLLTASDVGAKTELTINVTNLAANNTFTTALAGNSNFYTTLANNNSFSTALINNSFFTTTLAGDTNFTTTLAGDTNFINTLTANSTFISNVTTNIGTNGVVAVSATDTTPSFLDPKLNIHSSDSSVSVTKTITNSGANEILDYDLTTGANKPKHFDYSHIALNDSYFNGGYSDTEVYISNPTNYGAGAIFNVELPNALLQQYDPTADWATAKVSEGFVIIGGFIYLLFWENVTNNRRIYRYNVNNIAAGGTLMTIAGVALGTTATGNAVHMTSDGTDFFFTNTAGNSATDTNIISKYTLSGTTLTWVSNTTCGATASAFTAGFAVSAAGSYFGVGTTGTPLIKEFDNTGTLLETLTYSTSGTIYNWGNVFYLAVSNFGAINSYFANRLEWLGL